MRTQTGQYPQTGETVMICAHIDARNTTPCGARLILIPGGPRVFSNLDHRFFSAWLYFCDDCHTKATGDARKVADLIHGPLEWITERALAARATG